MKKEDLDLSIFDNILENAEVIPIMSKDDEERLLNEEVSAGEYPILPLRNNVLMPGIIVPINASRQSSIDLLKSAYHNSRKIVVLTQRNDVEEPSFSDLCHIGVVANVVKFVTLPNNLNMAIVQASSRVELKEIVSQSPELRGNVVPMPEEQPKRSDFHTLIVKMRRRFATLLKAHGMPQAVSNGIKSIKSDRMLLNSIASHIEAEPMHKQQMLECDGYDDRVELVIEAIEADLNYIRLCNEVQNKAKDQLDRQQREFFLNQQLHVIQEELNGSNMSEVDELQSRAETKKWGDDVAEVFQKELSKLKHMHVQSPDYSVQLNYLDLMLDLPWNEYSDDNYSIANARKVLDRDHYGIEKVKERIVEYLAVLSLKHDLKSPIICLVGPPGTGKTSLGKSIAQALERKYVRVALGGLHDESEIRGHRRTYIGAMPGRIIKGIKKAGTSNPVFILDEIDKVQGNTMHGDPTSALLEVLDPEQNNAFHDNFLDVDFDLSKVLFIATANSLNNIQPALLDRMEIIDLSGYILEEKVQIAKRHLLPRQIAEHGLKSNAVTIDDEVLATIINNYTRESGVRQLDKTLAKIVRRRAVDLVASLDSEKKGTKPRVRRAVKVEELKTILGLPIHISEQRGDNPLVGVATGLAWTAVGGEILFVESSLSDGKGTLSMTGNLGDVMKESATLAFEYIKSNADKFGIDKELISKSNIHIHVPEGATPKDGPSAGITMFVAMVSVFTKRRVRNNFAMTGEITLRGNVTPVGGIKEKILAAKRANITDIMLCEDNRRDIEDISQEYLSGLTFHYITEMHQAIPLVLVD